jgi:murein DD-endopeptidase MepM/ murein hydrolase activator NlpD
MVPLRGLQLLCCAVVAGLALHFTSGLFGRAHSTTQDAVSGFEQVALEIAAAQSAAEAALARLSEIKVVVKRNDTLDAIFRREGQSLTDLANIRAIEVARKGLDMLRPGVELTLVTRDGELVGLRRPLSISEILKVERHPEAGFVASVEQVPVTRHVQTAGGMIEPGSSLFLASTAAGLKDATIMELSEVFRWDVDFNRLQEGDAFTLVYEQHSDGRITEDGDILAAQFVNEGRTYRAVRYVRPDGKTEYYTPEGVSLRKAFLKSPVKFSRVSSTFNPRRRHPVLNTIRAHRGVDYAAPTGTEVLAAGSGRVQFRGVKGGFGNVVEIAHAGQVVTRYGHLSRFRKGVVNGTKVEQGDVIGYVGSTGLATGPHLHFEFIERGTHRDPQKAIRNSQPGPPVPATERATFDAQVAPLLARLDAAPAPVRSALAAR